MRGRVAFIGCTGVRTLRGDVAPLRLAPTAILSDPLQGFRAVVLGPVALRRIDPVSAWTALAPLRSRVVLCAEPSFSHGVVLPWVTCGFGVPVACEDLVERLATLDRAHVRPWIDFELWLPRVPVAGSPAGVAVATVFRLPQMKVHVWADRLGWRRDRLLDVCESGLGVCAKEALLGYVAGAYGRLRKDGATDEECADLLGYASASSLRRALGPASDAVDRIPQIVRRAPQIGLFGPVDVGSPEPRRLEDRRDGMRPSQTRAGGTR